MEARPEPEFHNSRYRDYVAHAAKAHLERLQTFGKRGWTSKEGSLVILSEDEAEDCSVAAFQRLMIAIDRRNEIVMQLVLDHEPDSKNTFRMLRSMFKFCAYDMFRKNGRMTTETALDGGVVDDDEDGAPSLFENLVVEYLEANPQADPKELFEARQDRRRIIGKALEMKLLNKTRQFILLAYLKGREDADIAEELRLETVQVQRHKWKIKEALMQARDALDKDY